jgi:hypothetical protein
VLLKKLYTYYRGPLADEFKKSLTKVSLGYDKNGGLNEDCAKN